MSIVDGVDYGPLASLIGTWEGNKGMDISPEPDGTEENPYYETIIFEAIGGLSNAEQQELTMLRYHQIVYRKSNDDVFHNETGYYIWDKDTKTVMQSIAVPRGISLLAGGVVSSYTDAQAEINVTAEEGHGDWGIVQSPFMKKTARTTRFTREISVNKDSLSYSQTTYLEIYDKKFDHTDKNILTRKAD